MYEKRGLGILMSGPTFFGMPYGFKNSLVVGQVYIPFDEVDTMFQSKSSVQIKVGLQVTEEAFNAIGGSWYFGIGQIVKHIGQGSFDRQVRAS